MALNTALGMQSRILHFIFECIPSNTKQLRMKATAPLHPLLTRLAIATAILTSPSAYANVVNVECYGNGDGTTSCQRLSDGEWFDCIRSVGAVSTCNSREVVPGRDEPITCTNNGAGIYSCTNTARQSSGDMLPGTSVFDF